MKLTYLTDSGPNEPTDQHDLSFQSNLSTFSPPKFSTPTKPLCNTAPRSRIFSSSSSRFTECNSTQTSNISTNHAKVHNSWRSLVINCNSIAGKHLVEYTDPDVLIMTETKLDSSISTAEFLPPGYQGQIRKDRTRSGGGVMLAFKSCSSVEEIERENIDAETAWAVIYFFWFTYFT